MKTAEPASPAEILGSPNHHERKTMRSLPKADAYHTGKIIS